MKVLITGASGFIGRHLTSLLISEGDDVTVLLKNRSEADRKTFEGASIAYGDVRNYAAVSSAASGMQVIYHLAALTRPDPSNPKALLETNVGGTENVARATLKHGVARLVHASSVAIYGRRIRNHQIDEDTVARPDSPYAESKLKAEKVLAKYRLNQGLPVVIARTTNVFGEGALDWLEFFQVIAAGHFRFIGDGSNLLQLTDVGDFCKGLHLCATRQGVVGRTFIISGGESISLREWISLICQETGGAILRPSIPSFPAKAYNLMNSLVYFVSKKELPRADRLIMFLGSRNFDISRARKELGYQPGATPMSIVQDTTRWFRSRGWL